MNNITNTDEWKQLRELAVRATNAVLCDDDILESHYYEEIRRIAELMFSRYGRDPIVLETLADYTPEFAEAKSLFEESIRLIDEKGGNSTSPRLSLAALIHDFSEDTEEIYRLIEGIEDAGLSSDDRQRLSDLRAGRHDE